jgi:predicted AAA+ superfamily ATPase
VDCFCRVYPVQFGYPFRIYDVYPEFTPGDRGQAVITRLLELPKDYSFFLFGARGTGKSTLLKASFAADNTLFINLLNPSEEIRFLRNPEELRQVVLALSPEIHFIVIDEVQKVPKLLDVVHLLLESDKSEKQFILTGSSAKQLKVSGVNLLAGRAFTYNLFPFSYLELGEAFDLNQALCFGMLPKIFSFPNDSYKVKFLQAYTMTYLKEEIWAERLVKNLQNFRCFLEVVAQSNGKVINYTNIARDVGVDDKTVKNYLTLLEDTLVGNFLEPFHHSFRKRLRIAPKFYYFDIGVSRALSATLSLKPTPSTSYYGELFEQFIIIECIKLKHYYQSEYKLSYLMTESGLEVDLIIERAGLPTLFIEIKSKEAVDERDLQSLLRLSADFDNCEAICLSQDPRKKNIQGVTVYPWQEGLRYIFGI